jgi:selenocysteine-specific elongation factor
MPVIATAGHVDHGKTALVKALTGVDTDRLPEEKRKGVSIDLGFAELPLSSELTVSIVDVPGHQRFVGNMLAGLGGIQGCLFVVAADEGWMPQSQEHLEVLNLLGISRGVIALTRSDLADADLVELATQEIDERIKGTSLAGAQIIQVSARDLRGIDLLRQELTRTVLEMTPAVDRARPRLWIDRTFSIKGSGTVVTGTLTDGAFELGQRVEILPHADEARIRGIQSHGAAQDVALPGTRVALNLGGIKHEVAARGSAVTRTDQWQVADLLGVEISTIREGIESISSRGAYILYVGSADLPVKCRLEPSKLLPGGIGFGILRPSQPIPVAVGDRFILRDAGRQMVVAGGRVLYASNEARQRRASTRVLSLLPERATKEGVALAVHVLETRGYCTHLELSHETGSAPDQTTAWVTELVAAGKAVQVAEHIVSAGWWAGVQRDLLVALSDFHRDEPARPGIPRELLIASLPYSRYFVEKGLEALAATAKVVPRGPTVALFDHEPILTSADKQKVAGLLSILKENATNPPLLADLEASGFPRTMIEHLIETGEIVRIDGEIVMAAEAFNAAVNILMSTMKSGAITVGEARDALKSSRKYVMPLLYLLDARGITRRAGDKRSMGPHGSEFVRSNIESVGTGEPHHV